MKLQVSAMVLVTMLVAGSGAVQGPASAKAMAGQAAEEDTSSPKLRIAWSDFIKLYESKRAVVIDVRAEPSFEAGHIPGARSIPLESIEKQAASLKKLGKPIVLYCA
jgi:3-mercaptopyruvate sulfurtransferase SseA